MVGGVVAFSGISVADTAVNEENQTVDEANTSLSEEDDIDVSVEDTESGGIEGTTSDKITKDLEERLDLILEDETETLTVDSQSADDGTSATITRGAIPNNRKVRILVSVAEDNALDETESKIQNYGTVHFVFSDQALIAADIPANELSQIEQIQAVEKISLDPKFEAESTTTSQSNQPSADSHTVSSTDSWGTEFINATLVHHANVTGEGVNVAIIDDGVDSHSGMQGKIIGEEDLAPNSQFDGDDPTDYTGHGSNVAGIVAASETTVKVPNNLSDENTRDIKGVAPGVSLLNAKIGTFSNEVENDPNLSGLEVNGLSDGEEVDVPVSIPQDGLWLRVGGSWSDANNDVTIELIDDDGNVINQIKDINGYDQPVEETVSEDTKTRLEVNGTSTLFTDTSTSSSTDGIVDISAIRVSGDSITGDEDVDLDVELYTDGVSSASNIAAGIHWAAGTDTPRPGVSVPDSSETADIISLSYSAGGTTNPINPVPGAMDAAVDNGTVFVTSAGNDGLATVSDVKAKTNIITVGAVDEDGDRAAFSQTGDEANDRYKPDVVAPGVDIPSAGPTTRIPSVDEDFNGTELSGTSQATPHVTGVAALYMQMYQQVHGEQPTPQQVRSAIIAGTFDPTESGDPLDQDYTDEKGMGVTNAYDTYLTFSFSGTNSGDEQQVTVSTPEELPENRITPSGENANITGTFYRQDQGDEFDVELDGTPATEYGPIAVAESNLTPSDTISFTIEGTAFGGTLDNDEEWALATHYPPISQQIGSERIDGYSFRSISLDPGESAAYVAPVEEDSNGVYFDNRGAIRAIAYYNSTEGDIDVVSELPADGASVSSDINTTQRNTEQVVTPQPTDSGKVVFEADETTGTVTLSHASNYPLIPLPSEAEVDVIDESAGNASNPGQIELEVEIENGNLPYTYQGYDAPNGSNFTVQVGQREANNVTATELRQDKYRIRANAPTQPTTGSFNLSVEFTDSKHGISHTAEATEEDAIGYSGEGSSGASSVSLILDVSGSMGSGPGSDLRQAKDASSVFLQQMNDDDNVAFVIYGSDAQNETEMTRIEGNRSQIDQTILNADNSETGRLTNIGDGLILSRQNLDIAPEGSSKAAILLSDGNRNRGPSESEILNTIMPVYDANNYDTYTIAFGTGADEQLMKDIANVTDESGDVSASPDQRFYSDPDQDQIRQIYQNIQDLVAATSTIQSSSGSVPSGSTAQESVSIDESVDTTNINIDLDSSESSSSEASTDVTADQTQSGSTETKLYDPSGDLVERNQSSATGTNRSNVEYSSVGDTTTYRLTEPQPGDWSYEIVNQDTETVDYDSSVTASTSTSLSVATNSQEYTNGSTATVSATLLGSSGGLSGASVDAEVTKPDGSTVTVPMSEEESGQYVGTISLDDNGQYTAEITAEDGDVTRTEDTSWSVIDKSSVLQVTASTDLTTTIGGETSGELTAARPIQSGTTVSSSSTSGNESAADNSTDNELSDFESQARELATFSREEIHEANVSEPIREAALTIKDARDGEEGAAVIDVESTASSSSSQGATVFVSTTDLTDPGDKSISASRISVTPQSYTAAEGSDRNVTVEVNVPNEVSDGTYTGNVTFAVDGTVVEEQIELTVTEASADVYTKRITETTTDWESASPSGKAFYEEEIADHLTRLYFKTDSADGITLSESSGEAVRMEGGE